jgi:hypothetical protein
VNPARITLLVEDLSLLATALPGDRRYPALERILARGDYRRMPAESPNHLRCRLFGLEPSGHLPVAALSRVSRSGFGTGSDAYWLRADPVTMRADMTRVFMTSCGFSGFDSAERTAISRIVQEALLREGLDLQGEQPPWCFPLQQALEFEFMPLHEALGLDMAEALPVHESARTWKRIMTDIQVELHQCEVNEQRRARGQPELNSVWFWGGGSLPDRVDRVFETVVSDDPVSRGLGLLAGSETHPLAELEPGEGMHFIDWEMASQDALKEAEAVEQVAGHLLDVCTRGRLSLDLLDGKGGAWRYDAGARFRFWKRAEPLAETFKRIESE